MKRGRKPIDKDFKAKRISASISPQVYQEYQALLSAGLAMSTIIETTIHREYKKALKANKCNETDLAGQVSLDNMQ